MFRWIPEWIPHGGLLLQQPKKNPKCAMAREAMVVRLTIKVQYHQDLGRPLKVYHFTCAKFGLVYPIVHSSSHADATSVPRSLAPTTSP